MNNEFTRVVNLVGEENLAKIQSKTVLIVGLGGVGGYACESIVRSGVGKIIIVDKDVVDITNLNRQIIATQETIGKSKCEVIRERMLSINPKLEVKSYEMFVSTDNFDIIFEDKIDYVVDAIDTMSTKVALWKYCQEKGVKIISSLGMARRLDPSKICITKLAKTENDPMARALRGIARKNGVSLDIPVVFSKELPLEDSKSEKSNLGSMTFVPATAGLMCGYYVISDIVDIKK